MAGSKALQSGAAVVLALAAPATGVEPVRISPSSPWNLRYDEQACRLARTFGTGDTKITLIMAKYAPGPTMEVLLSGPSLALKGATFRYRFHPAETFDEAGEVLYGVAPATGTTLQFSAGFLPLAEREKLADWRSEVGLEQIRAMEARQVAVISAFEVGKGVKEPFVLMTGKMDKAVTGLETCLDDLVKFWGFDPAVQSSLSSLPQPTSDPGRWLTFQNYPSDLVRKNVSGAVRVRLDVEVDGNPSKCTVQGNHSDPAFEDVTCRTLMRHARFKPARDSHGAAVRSYWATAVVFTLGG